MRDLLSTGVVTLLYNKMSRTFAAGNSSYGTLTFDNRTTALYIHFPFCDTICKYCPFSRTAQNDTMDEYMNALLLELEQLASTGQIKNTKLSSLAFGGGTPSLIPENYLRRLMKRLSELFPSFESIQKTMECTPESITEERLQLFNEVGINRLSIGVQSLQNKVLDELHRQSNRDLIIGKLKLIQDIWPGLWSCDLIYGFQSHTEKQFLDDINDIVEFGVDHLTIFPLINSDAQNRQALSSRDFSRMKSMHRQASDLLTSKGFSPYSIEDFAKTPEAELEYQKDVWAAPQKDMIILGTGGFGISDSIQYRKTRNKEIYIAQVNEDKYPVDRYQFIPKSREPIIRSIMGLHYNTINFEGNRVLGFALKSGGLATISKHKITLTQQGRFITSLLWAKIMLDRMN